MKLDAEFYKLPFNFNIEKMQEEVNYFKSSEWMPHPTGFIGNSSLPLISVDGKNNDDFTGTMRETPQLKKCFYLRQVIASFNEVFGRSRLMKLGGHSEVPEHSDLNYHWYNRVRIHIPIITYPEIKFYCGNKSVHMAAGETWIFNSWEMHKVINPTDKERVHLVIDTTGSSKFWEMVNGSDRPQDNIMKDTPKFIDYVPNKRTTITTETYNVATIMSPGEVDALCIDISTDAASYTNNNISTLKTFIHILNTFRYDWRALWSICGSNPNKIDSNKYIELVTLCKKRLNTISNLTLASNESNAIQVFYARILNVCINLTSNQTINNKESNIFKSSSKNSPCPCGSGKKYKRCHGQ